MRKKCIVCSNMLNEVHNLEEWFGFVQKLADGIVIVDSGSTDGTIEFAQAQPNTVVVVNDTIQKEGYGYARNELRFLAKKHFQDAHWCVYFDGDERIKKEEFHTFRFLRDCLVDDFDVIAFPRIDWKPDGTMAKDVVAYPDYQARMTRLSSPLMYIRKLHEQMKNFKAIYADIGTPKINHYHRTAGQEVRDKVGKLCAKLHMEDKVYGNSYPMHHKEEYYRERYLKEGL